MADIARHWLDGGWLESERIAVSYNPATGELLGRFADGGEAEARTAVHAARHAFAGTMWGRDRALPGAAGTGRVFEVRAPELAPMLTRENGKTLAEATREVGAPAPTLRHCAAQTLTELGTAAEVVPGQLHRQYRGRPTDRRSCCQDAETAEPGARRQDSDDRVRRCVAYLHSAAFGRRCDDVCRPELHGGLSDPRPAGYRRSGARTPGGTAVTCCGRARRGEEHPDRPLDRLHGRGARRSDR